MRVTALTVTNKEGHEWLISTEDAEELADTLNQFYNRKEAHSMWTQRVLVGVAVVVAANFLGMDVPTVLSWVGF